MDRFSRRRPPVGSIEWAAKRIRRILDAEEAALTRAYATRLVQSGPDMESVPLDPMPKQPENDPGGGWQHTPGIRPHYHSGSRQFETDLWDDEGFHQLAPLPPEYRFTTPEIDPTQIPNWRPRTPIYRENPVDPTGPPELKPDNVDPYYDAVPPGGYRSDIPIGMRWSDARRPGHVPGWWRRVRR